MKYLCLICAEPQVTMEGMAPADAEKHFEEYREFTESIRRSGQLVSCNRLLPASSAATIRVRNGKVLATDGPYAETKEQLGGYYLIDVPSFEDAVEWASRCPAAEHGAIEVRPIWELGDARG